MSSVCLAPVLSLNVHLLATTKERHNMRFLRDCVQGSIIKKHDHWRYCSEVCRPLANSEQLVSLKQLSGCRFGALWLCRGTEGGHGASPN